MPDATVRAPAPPAPRSGTPVGLHVLQTQFVMRTEREDITIHLGPAWFILYQDMSIAVNDKCIEMRSCCTSINSKPVIMASTIVKRDKVLLLRDKDGIPFWCA